MFVVLWGSCAGLVTRLYLLVSLTGAAGVRNGEESSPKIRGGGGGWGWGAKTELILIGNVKGWNGIAAVLCILITADNRSPAILKSPIHPLPPPINGSSFKWPGCCVTLLFTRLYVGPGRRKLT